MQDLFEQRQSSCNVWGQSSKGERQASRQSCLPQPCSLPPCRCCHQPANGNQHRARSPPATSRAKAGTTHAEHAKPSFCCFSLRRGIFPHKKIKEQRSRWDAQMQGKAGPLRAKLAMKCRLSSPEPRSGELQQLKGEVMVCIGLSGSWAGYFGAQQKRDCSGSSLYTVHAVLKLDQSHTPHLI